MGMSNYVMEERDAEIRSRVTVDIDRTGYAPANLRYSAYVTTHYSGGSDEALPIRGYGATEADAISELLSELEGEI